MSHDYKKRSKNFCSSFLILGLGCLAVACSETADENFDVSEAEAIAEAAAEEAAADVEFSEQSLEPIATCDSPPANGTILSRDTTMGTGDHQISILNGSNGNTIVNVRDGNTNDLLLSFYVEEKGETAIKDIPDGEYRVQYAFGDALGENCKSFAVIQGASKDPELLEFEAGSRMRLRYELLPQVDGNFTGQPIDPSEFLAE